MDMSAVARRAGRVRSRTAENRASIESADTDPIRDHGESIRGEHPGGLRRRVMPNPPSWAEDPVVTNKRWKENQ